MSSPSVTERGSFLALTACVLLSGLAAGAIWCLLSLLVDVDTTVLLVPLAFAIGRFLRWQGFGHRRGAIGAVIATLIAFVYAQYICAAMRMADMLGFPLRDTLFKMDFRFAWRVVRSTLSGWDLVILIAAVAVAVITTAWSRGRLSARRRRPSP